ncbi:NACHT domain-containing protein [Streptomyces shenzhenensis]|uniref:NACHT domain-containing protein n=1 Tax=Streptomyces shenzhenensis TaxID=943815 RepID=UPI0033F7489D
MFEVVAGKIAASSLDATTAPIRKNVIPGQGAAITSGPFLGRLKFKQPVEVDRSDVERLTKHLLRRIKDISETEFAGLLENEKEAVLHLVADVFERSERSVWDCDLDPQIFAVHLIRISRERVKSYALSAQAESYFEFLTHQVSLQVVQFITTWPSFTARVELEQMKRLRKLVTTVEKINEKLGPVLLSSDIDFEQKYTDLVSETLDQLELFGVDLKDRNNRTYSLTTAYITLSVSSVGLPSTPHSQDFRMGRGGDAIEADDENQSLVVSSQTSTAGMRAEGAIARYKRLLLRGDAGSGKTTLLHWLAVNSSRRTLPSEIAEWNMLVPFVLPLRRFAESSLPTPNNFFPEVGTHLADEMPDRWVTRLLSSGRALVLVDGVDELPSDRRETVRSWLRQLVKTYPESYYLVTSRPAAAEADWLAQDGFAVLDMLPMTQGDVSNFIEHWHDAARASVSDSSEVPQLDLQQADLIRSVRESRQLRRLASNPLLCALLCTLNRDRNSQLPKDRMELYRAALDMLLLRRDRERRINYPEPTQLGDAQKKSILGDFAYWLMRNGLSDSPESQAIKQISISLQSMVNVDATAEAVYDYLLVRSGCLRRPVENRVDFVHRTFQEYLAAARIVEVDDLKGLLSHAHLDQWHEVVVMAVGHARPRERAEILTALLDRGDSEPAFKHRLHLLAAACLETVGECNPSVYERVKSSTAKLIPPRRMTEAKEIAAAGEMVIPLIPNRRLPAPTAAATVRMASLVGGDGALSLISRFAKDDRVTVQREIGRAWSYFDAVDYAKSVIQKNPFRWTEFSVQIPHYLPALRHLPQLRRLQVMCEFEDWSWVPRSDLLEHVHIYRNSKPVNFECLARAPKLKHAGFRVPGETDFDPLARFGSLQSLSLRALSGELTLPEMQRLAKLSVMGGIVDLELLHQSAPAMQGITLSSNVKSLSSLRKFSKLRTVSLSKQSGSVIEALAGNPTLRRISIVITEAEVEWIAALAEIPELEYLSLSFFDPDDRDEPIELDVRALAEKRDLKLVVHYAPSSLNVIGAEDRSTMLVENYGSRRQNFVIDSERL